MSCVFCGILPTVYQTGEFKVVQDIRPRANTHLLIVPRSHLESWDKDLESLYRAIHLSMQFKGAGRSLVINFGTAQEVPHAHLHLMSEHKLSTPDSL